MTLLTEGIMSPMRLPWGSEVRKTSSDTWRTFTQIRKFPRDLQTTTGSRPVQVHLGQIFFWSKIYIQVVIFCRNFLLAPWRSSSSLSLYIYINTWPVTAFDTWQSSIFVFNPPPPFSTRYIPLLEELQRKLSTICVLQDRLKNYYSFFHRSFCSCRKLEDVLKVSHRQKEHCLMFMPRCVWLPQGFWHHISTKIFQCIVWGLELRMRDLFSTFFSKPLFPFIPGLFLSRIKGYPPQIHWWKVLLLPQKLFSLCPWKNSLHFCGNPITI